MKHRVDVKFAGQVVGTAEISDSGEVVSGNVDETKIPEQYRSNFDITKHVSLMDEPQTWENNTQF